MKFTAKQVQFNNICYIGYMEPPDRSPFNFRRKSSLITTVNTGKNAPDNPAPDNVCSIPESDIGYADNLCRFPMSVL